jgi:CheY-like chemotaxis protein
VLKELHVTPTLANSADAALTLIEAHEFEVIVVDWREVDNLGDFLCAVRRSNLNPDCVLVAIVRDLLDLRQAFAAGVHFLIHKPASVVQIERCLRAAYSATVARRRKQHREPVNLEAVIRTRTQPCAEATIVNLSEHGVGLRIDRADDVVGALGAGDDVDLRFNLPYADDTLQVTGVVVWTTASHCGIRFTFISDTGRAALEQWLTACVERSLSELRERMRSACA